MRKLLTLFAFLFLATNAQASGKLALHGQAEVVPPPPLTQTAYFGSKTFVGNGGAVPTGIVLPATAPDTTSYYWEPTFQWAVPKNGAVKTYNAIRGTPLSGCEVMTVTDAAAQIFTYNLCVDNAKAGDYTIRWRDGDTQNSTGGNNQLEIAVSRALPDEVIAWRKDTTGLNTTQSTDLAFHGTVVFRFSCNIAASRCASANRTWFTGSNYVTLRPETGGALHIGFMNFEGIYGLKVTGVNFGGAGYMTMANCVQGCYLLGGIVGSGSNNIWIDGNTFEGNPNENCLTITSTCGKLTPSGILQPTDASNIKVTNNTFNYVFNGVILAQAPGTWPGDLNGTAPATVGTPGTTTFKDLSLIIDNNLFTNVRADMFDIACMHHAQITNNIAYDAKRSVAIGTASTTPAWINPFDANKQKHADFSQNDCPTGVYEFWPNVTINNNFLSRGIGTDALPYWSTASGYPNPNPTGTCTSGGCLTPNVNVGVSAGQGLYFSNWAGAAGHIMNGSGSVVRPYDEVLTNFEMKDNIIITDLVRGISLPPIKDSVLTGNVVVASHSAPGVATNLNDQSSTWNFGLTAIVLEKNVQTSPVLGTTVVKRNISGNAIQCVGCTLTNNASNIGNNTLNLTFQNPDANGVPRSIAEYKAGFLPIDNGPAEVCTNVFAGPWRPDGSAETGSCP